ncbi:hypothetical protein [Nonlabens ulvanivorans]|uniref:Decarboxylase n=1 Tax=Nonlabens ulvanivorans TaxID=906888 RepID=A0A084JZ76_NONUL|nr:hypothetical protein [Nonlabens ulvanivorans]KEZ94260.1 decarboxylase [Nonlabens ulvanivorans]PRX13253.1 acetolactate decarboxylase [Nonlabens ulvanivorans]
MNKLFFLSIICFLILCSCEKKKQTDYTVKNTGALMNIMSGNLVATASLDSIHELPHLYALGALENLKGEVQIFDSESYVSKESDDNRVTIESHFNHQAALLVYAQVENWTTAINLDGFFDNNQLEQQLEIHAIKNAIDTEKPFPFLLKGTVDLLNWHVINWIDGDLVHNHKKHKESGAYGTIENQEVEIIGFYSKKHKAVFTHHTTFLHMHFRTISPTVIAGHIDGLKGSNLSLYLPKK